MAAVGRVHVRRVALALTASFVLAVALPGVVVAQSGGSNPFGPLPQPTGTVPQTTTTSAPSIVQTTTTAGSSSVSGAGIAAIAVGAIVILIGISFFIWRDARKRAPVKGGVVATTGGSKPRPKSRKLSPAERKRRKRGRAR